MRRFLALVVGFAALAGASDGQAAGAPNGAALYADRCASCHDNAVDRTPSRETLSENPPGFILRAMRDGAAGCRLEGVKTMVPAAQLASHVIVPARCDDTSRPETRGNPAGSSTGTIRGSGMGGMVRGG